MIDHIKKQVDRGLIIIGILLMVGIGFLGSSFRDMVGQTIGMALDPAVNSIGQNHFYVIILIMAIIVSICSTILQLYMTDMDLFRSVQERNKSFQKELRAATMAKDIEKMRALDKQQKEMFVDQMTVSKQQLKPAAYVSIISVPIWTWMYWYLNIHNSISIMLPLVGERLLVESAWGPIPLWSLLYLFVLIFVGIIAKKFIEN